jgi:RHS repeat-associated protein
MSLNHITTTMKTLAGAVLVLLFCFALFQSGNCASYVGPVGDKINYYNGELQLRENDLSLSGRHGLDVVISRHYSSTVYAPDTVRHHGEFKSYRAQSDSNLFRYLGQGWHVEYPYLYNRSSTRAGATHRDLALVQQDGSVERFSLNLDTLTKSHYPLRTPGRALLNQRYPFLADSTQPDTMLLLDGTRWIFGQMLHDQKLLTKMISRFDDELVVEYYSNSRWIKRVTSPIGRVVNFRYGPGTDTSLYSYVNTPPDTALLCGLDYLNYNDSVTLGIRYRYETSLKSKLLKYVISPMGDTTSYTYTRDILYADPNTTYRTDTFTVDPIYFLGGYKGPAGATAQWKYRMITLPVLDTLALASTSPNEDNRWYYKSYIGVYERTSESDSLRINYRQCQNNLRGFSEQKFVTSATTVSHRDSTSEEYYFYAEAAKDWPFEPFRSYYTYSAVGYQPAALFQSNGIYGRDTVCTGYSYGDPYYGYAQTGQRCDTSWDTVFTSAYYHDSLHIDHINTSVDSTKIYAPLVSYVHQGVGYYHDAGSPWDRVIFGQPEKNWWTAYAVQNPSAPDLQSSSVVAPRNFQYVLDTDSTSSTYGDSLFDSYYWMCPWSLCGFGPGRSLCSQCEPASDTLPYTKDTVLNWIYVPTFNLVLITKEEHIERYHGKTIGKITEYEYDSSNRYLLSAKHEYMDTLYYDSPGPHSIVPLTTSYTYDAHFNLWGIHPPDGNTQVNLYDDSTHSRLYQRVDTSLGGVTKTNVYFPGGQLRLQIGQNFDTTRFVYDKFGRDSLVFGPSDPIRFLLRRTYHNAARTAETAVRVDSTHFIETSELFDSYSRAVRNSIRVDSSTNITDSLVYDSYGSLTKRMTAKFLADTTVFTSTQFDKSLRRLKTISSDGKLSDSIRYLDSYTTDTRSSSGIRTRVRKDWFGNTLASYLGDSSACETCFVAIESVKYSYGPFGQIQSIDSRGLQRSTTYDEFGRVIQSIDPDAGTRRVWYDRFGHVRLTKQSTDTAFGYVKYDCDYRTIEEGTVPSADTTLVDSANYPPSSNTSKRVFSTYRYGSYSTSQIAADTTDTLRYFRGRLTEVVDTSGYTYYYYNKSGQVGLKTTWIKGLGSAQKLWFTYNLNGSVRRITYPNGQHTDYTYNSRGLLSGVSDIVGVDSIKYTATGAVASVNYKNGLKSRFGYDLVGRLLYTANWSSHDIFFNRRYVYDEDNTGQLLDEFVCDSTGSGSSEQLRSYVYDYRGRLTAAGIKAPGQTGAMKTISYTYDANDNIGYRKIAGVDSLYHTYSPNTNFDSLARFSDDSVWVLNRDGRGRTSKITKYSSITDTVFNHWGANHRTYLKYDYRNLLTMAIVEAPNVPSDTVVNLYDALGQKVKQTLVYHVYVRPIDDTVGVDGMTPGGGDEESDQMSTSGEFETDFANGPHWESRTTTRYYIWSSGRVLLELSGSSVLSNINIYGLGRQLARRECLGGSDSLNTFISDYQGTLRATVRASGYASDRIIEYYPYGSISYIEGSNVSHRQYIGKEIDNVGKLDFGPRYYDPVLGHFLVPDPLLSAPSAYAYTFGNPIAQSDPTGLAVGPIPPPKQDVLAIMDAQEAARMLNQPGTRVVLSSDIADENFDGFGNPIYYIVQVTKGGKLVDMYIEFGGKIIDQAHKDAIDEFNSRNQDALSHKPASNGEGCGGVPFRGFFILALATGGRDNGSNSAGEGEKHKSLGQLFGQITLDLF